jgi:uncharacterized protein
MTLPPVVEPRTYRTVDEDDRFKVFRVIVETSDLYVKAHSNLEAQTEDLIRTCRSQIERAIERRREFLVSLLPVPADPGDAAVVLRMIAAAEKAGTGPMAAVAGAVAEFVGKALLKWSPEVIVENGGDIFLKIAKPVVVGIFAGQSPFSGRIGIVVEPSPMPIGICTSSATVGPSLSLGRADAATVISKDVVLADAVATALGNRVQRGQDVSNAVEWALKVPGVDGALAILGEKFSALGQIEITPIEI